MKTLLLTIALLTMGFAQSQDINTIFKDKIQPNSTTAELKEGLYQIEELCAVEPQDKCKKAKAAALYLIANDYYAIVYQLNQVDPKLVDPILKKADRYYNKAVELFPMSDFPKSQQSMLVEYKLLLEN